MPKKPTKFVPNYQQIINDIRGRIKSGALTDGIQLPSERELGLHYKVSRQTIRTAITTLAAGGWIESRPGKGNFVMAGRTKSKAGKFRAPTRQIGLICRSTQMKEQLSLGNLLWGLNSAFSSHGYSVVVSADVADRANKIEPLFPGWIKSGAMDGYILASANVRVQELFATLRVPAVNLGYLWSGADLPSVTLNFRSIYRRCVQFLATENYLPLCNFVPTPRTIHGEVFVKEIVAGHREGVDLAGLTPFQARIVEYPGSGAAYDLVMSIRRALKDKPRALVFESAKYLDEIIEFLTNSGYRVPEDILVLTINSVGFASPHHYRTATLQFPSSQGALLAGEKLLRLMETGSVEPRNELLDMGEFVLPVSLQTSAPASAF